MFVWWAVFFFAGSFFPADPGPAHALAALALSLRYRHSRSIITAFTGLIVFGTAALFPAGTGTRIRNSECIPAPAAAAREAVSNAIDRGGLSDRSRSMLKALLIADRSGLSAGTLHDWRSSGAAHFLALSGLHLGLIAVPLFTFLALLGLRGILRETAALAALSFYAAVAGFPGSLLRALSMVSFIRLGKLAGTRAGLASAVLSGSFLVCLFRPGALGDTGFLLSFCAASGIALLGIPAARTVSALLPPGRAGRLIRYPFSALTVSLSVQMFMLPVTTAIFGFASASGPVMSVLIALPVTFLLYSGIVHVATFSSAGPLVEIPVDAAALLAEWLVSTASRLSRVFVTASLFDIRLYVPGIALLSAGLRAENRARLLAAVGLLLTATSFYPVMDRGGPPGPVALAGGSSVLFGRGDAILVLERMPLPWPAVRIVSEARTNGAGKISAVVIRGAAAGTDEGMEIILSSLDPDEVLVSPWLDDWTAVRSDTVLVAGETAILVRPPLVFPARGVSATAEEAALVISPLDWKARDR
jgi:ComEC/Rec2-related protein